MLANSHVRLVPKPELLNKACILDFVLNFPGYHRWKFTDVLRNVFKIVVSLAWLIVLLVFYMKSLPVLPKNIKDLLTRLPQVNSMPPLYIVAVVLYLLPNILAAVIFIFPMLRRWIENSDWHIVRCLLWWSQGALNESGRDEVAASGSKVTCEVSQVLFYEQVRIFLLSRDWCLYYWCLELFVLRDWCLYNWCLELFVLLVILLAENSEFRI
ncbi:hypothetical protein ACHQM5_001481 [Ranunculus cassubicifolius]